MLCSAPLVILVWVNQPLFNPITSTAAHPALMDMELWGELLPQSTELSVGREGKGESADIAEQIPHFQESHFQPLNVLHVPPQVLDLPCRVQECCYY